MAKQALEQIRLAEAEAQRITDAIPLRVKALTDEAERRRRAYVAEAEQTAEQETSAQLAQLRERAEMLIARSSAEAENAADALRAEARGNMPEAVKLIVWGIVAKCQ